VTVGAPPLTALSTRNGHERPEGVEEGSVTPYGSRPPPSGKPTPFPKRKAVAPDRAARPGADNRVPNASPRAVSVTLSHTTYVNRAV
jgi:hypothetical protein